MRFFLLLATSVVAAAMSDANHQQQDPQLLDVIGNRILLEHSLVEPAAAATDTLLEHYGSPTTGCDDDEMAFQISGIPGGVCARKCTDFLPCPTDVPDGVSATPMCALQDPSTGDQYCILVCSSSSSDNNNHNINMPQLRHSLMVRDEQCGEAICRPVEGQDGLGICTYDV